MTTVLSAKRADREVTRVDTWWRANRQGAPDLFLDEFVDTVRRLALTPRIGTGYEPYESSNVRRVVMQSTRYHVYFRYIDERDEVVIVSVWSALRGRGPKLRVLIDTAPPSRLPRFASNTGGSFSKLANEWTATSFACESGHTPRQPVRAPHGGSAVRFGIIQENPELYS